jgi:hypothetical protein
MKRVIARVVLAASTAFALGLSGSVLAGQEPFKAQSTADGQPDIQGAWRGDPFSTCNLETGQCHEDNNITQGRAQRVRKPTISIVDPKDGRMPYQPWAAAKREEMENRRNDPQSRRDIFPGTLCLFGMPRLSGFRVTQTPGFVVMTWENNHGYRVIPLAGAPHVGDGVKLAFGDARGRWEGNTLVVSTTNLNDWTWLDAAASFHSDALTLVERLTIADSNTLVYQVTVDDPKVYTRPWSVEVRLRRTQAAAGDDFAGEFLEDACVEGTERNLSRMLRGMDHRR